MTESQREPVPRVDSGEVDTALAFLDFARASVLKKLDGLSEADAQREVLPTGTGLVRLVRHLTDGESFWFGTVFRDVGDEPIWDAVSDEEQPVRSVVADYRAAIDQSNAVIRSAPPDALSLGTIDGEHKTLRWIIAHMTSETARHAGHADAVCELIDGVTGR